MWKAEVQSKMLPFFPSSMYIDVSNITDAKKQEVKKFDSYYSRWLESHRKYPFSKSSLLWMTWINQIIFMFLFEIVKV